MADHAPSTRFSSTTAEDPRNADRGDDRLPKMASIEVHRDPDSLADSLRKYKLVVDQSIVAKLGPGEACTIDVSTGSHQVFLKVDWCRSDMLEVDLTAGEIAKLVCRPRSGIFTDLYWITFGRRRYISLTREDDDGP